jgi:hypothetical protein
MVTTRSSAAAADLAASKAAEAAIARGGNRELRKVLDIKPRRRQTRQAPKAAAGGCAAQDREIARLRGIVDQLKAGLEVSRRRAAARAPPFRQANLFHQDPARAYYPAGVPFEHEAAWHATQRGEANDRKAAKGRLPARPRLPSRPATPDRPETKTIRVGDLPPKKRALYGWNKNSNNKQVRVPINF